MASVTRAASLRDSGSKDEHCSGLPTESHVAEQLVGGGGDDGGSGSEGGNGGDGGSNSRMYSRKLSGPVWWVMYMYGPFALLQP